MNSQKINSLLYAQPYQSLLILTADDERTVLQSPQFATVDGTTLEIGMALDQNGWPTMMRYININQISMIDPMPTSESDGQERFR
jgi:hypothetical protein